MKLQVLYECDIDGKEHVAISELQPSGAIGPDEKEPTHHDADEVVESPPALDARPVDSQDGLSDCECAVVPHDKEEEDKVQGTEVQIPVDQG